MSRIYNSGGPGYTLNKAALKLLVTGGWGGDPDRERYAEDVWVAKAFLEEGVMGYDTKDETGAERYMHYPVSRRQYGAGYHMFPGLSADSSTAAWLTLH
jgi:hypothetical protein